MSDAPAVEVPSTPTVRRPGVTSRSLWLLGYAATVIAIAARAPSLRRYVDGRLSDVTHAAGLTDQRLQGLAVNTGMFLAVILSLAVLWMYYSLAAVMERTLWPVSVPGPRGTRAGPFFLVAVLATLPVHVVSAAAGIVSPKNEPLYFLYVLLVGMVTPVVFAGSLRRAGRTRTMVILFLSTGLATLSIAM